jgi:hypothetical protein
VGAAWEGNRASHEPRNLFDGVEETKEVVFGSDIQARSRDLGRRAACEYMAVG